MPFMFSVSPDFTPEHLSGWYIFNTWLQKQTGLGIHLEMYDDFQTQRAAIQAGQIDLIYANPFDAAMLVREKGFLPLVKAEGKSDEAIIAVAAESAVHDVADLLPGTRVAFTDDPDVHLMGMIMLEPGDLDKDNIQSMPVDSYVLVAKHLLKGDADVGIFLAEAYDDLSVMVKKQLRILVRSQISVIHHALMVGPKLQDQREAIRDTLLAMPDDEKGRGVLSSLGFQAWQTVTDENMEFMIDLMDTLNT
ncbi:MAG: phosphate/phosphite/phosphonate ABC transporter substrate-binding protein [Methylomonas sp.]|nr:phosphate/phosphite/phosphonate ABC transporter substrate-binding protein [Methylomonas sp.]PPD20113.1 MAG: phosphate ABC transporter substrate-binding protein [Methylomonas sp.]PPD24249.1 MAG: phosphate ABC transporter substrate-binding protein [Methylomonas sp.]PPD32857.1 MAG: phosphate ABC transporter substrate-binding protein [Methylomonas sp.]PPD37925.1 MAG: phosphate ABC transporter substrate-binding protein [Methylomonas sp.]